MKINTVTENQQSFHAWKPRKYFLPKMYVFVRRFPASPVCRSGDRILQVMINMEHWRMIVAQGNRSTKRYIFSSFIFPHKFLQYLVQDCSRLSTLSGQLAV